MKIIDGESYDKLLSSIAIIMNVTKSDIQNELNKYPNDLIDKEFIEQFYNSQFYKNHNSNYDGIYLFHLTRCTDEMLQNIKEKGLLKPKEAIKYIKMDIANHFNVIGLKQTLLNIDDNSLKRNPVDNNIYAMSVNINDESFKKIDKRKSYHFLDKQSGPEYVRDILNILQQKYDYTLDYLKFTKPYIVKVFIDKEDLEKTEKYENLLKKINISLGDYYLLQYLYIVYIFLNNINTDFSSYTCNQNILIKIIEVEEQDE